MCIRDRREVDLAALLARIPACRAIVTTGQKATDTLRALTGCDSPAVGAVSYTHLDVYKRQMRRAT